MAKSAINPRDRFIFVSVTGKLLLDGRLHPRRRSAAEAASGASACWAGGPFAQWTLFESATESSRQHSMAIWNEVSTLLCHDGF